MGYRSDVYCVLKSEDYLELKQKFDNKNFYKGTLKIDGLIDYHEEFIEKHDNSKYTYFVINYVKWYKGFPEVEFIDNYIINSKYYDYIIIGEDGYTDEYHSDNSEYFIDPIIDVSKNWTVLTDNN